MTTTRWLIVAIGAAGIAAACVYPVWESRAPDQAARRDRGRAFVFAPPAEKAYWTTPEEVDFWNVTISTKRMGIELLAVLAVTGFLFGMDCALDAWVKSTRKHPHPNRKVIIDVLTAAVTVALITFIVGSVYIMYKRERLADPGTKEIDAAIRRIDEALGKR